MQIDRLFGIVYILLERKTTTAAKLASHFEVSKRTILRDLDTLTIAGIPVYTTKGKGGGISILDNFILNKTTISDHEQNQILIALQSLASTQNIETNNLIAKLSALFKKTDTSWLEVDFSRWGNIRSDKEQFELLRDAIIKKIPLSFTYPSSNGFITKRTIYPLKLIFKSKAWYVQAYCLERKDYRTFKTTRMLQIEILPTSFAPQHLPPPPKDLEIFPSPELVHLKLVFAADVAYRVYDEFDSKDVKKNDDGSFIVDIDLPNDPWLNGFLLSFGASVKIIQPKNLNDQLISHIKALEKFYSNK